MRSVRALLAALALGAAVVVAPAAAPGPVAGVGPLPDCRLDDILTEPRGYDDWSITHVDWILSVGPDYKPPDLVSVREGGVAGGGYVREVVIDDLKAMAAAAKANGTPLVAWSPYRSYSQQRKLFETYARGYGFDRAINFSARPGHSEHQLGLTIDFVAVGDDGLTSNWEVTKTGAWMAKNAWKYGWLMSYPKGKQEVTCYSYEPWHYRYVGRELAKAIHESGLTIREYLWANHSLVDPTCAAIPAPSLGGPARSCPLPTPSPTAPPTPVPSPSPTIGPSVPPSSSAAPSAAPPSATPSAGPPAGIVSAILALGAPGAIALVLGLILAVAVAARLVMRRGVSRARPMNPGP